MANQVYISIITVTYNSEKTLKHTINSLLQQSYRNFEYIIIDGKSTDSTVEIIKEYEDVFKKNGIGYRWISEKDNGLYHAMNKGIRIAKGDLIGIINSDDFYHKDVLSLMNDNYIEDADIYYGDIIKIINDKNIYSKGFINREFLHKMRINHPSMFVKSIIYKKYGSFNEEYKIGADRDLVLRFLNKNLNFKYINSPISYYSLTGLSSDFSSIQKIKRRIVEERNILKSNKISRKDCRNILRRKRLSGLLNWVITKLFGNKGYDNFLKFKFTIKDGK